MSVRVRHCLIALVACIAFVLQSRLSTVGDHSEASNILSVAYDLNDLIMYTAWENGMCVD